MKPRPDNVRDVQRRLLRWYSRNARAMPWRGVRDPYAVWVSEIMLQQTQVETVKPYFERWMRRFADVASLARAKPHDVMKAWEGLGYYSRARNLQRAAQVIVNECGGEIPSTAQALRKLPGIGPYTAGAVSSIAFGCDEPVVDGNVARVLCRLFRIRRNPRENAVQKRLWALAEELLPKGEAGDFNQALMDLGATLCLPRRPECGRCPLRKNCRALAHGEQDRLPAARRRPAVPHYDIAAGVIRRAGRILIAQRRENGLLGGLWEFPGGKREPGESLEDCLRREIREEVALEVADIRPLATARHAYSHFRITLHVFECRHGSGTARAIDCARVKWVRASQLHNYPFPAANRRIIALLTPAASD